MTLTPADVQKRLKQLFDMHPYDPTAEDEAQRTRYVFIDAADELLSQLSNEELGALLRFPTIRPERFGYMEIATGHLGTPSDEVVKGLVRDILWNHMDDNLRAESDRRWKLYNEHRGPAASAAFV